MKMLFLLVQGHWVLRLCRPEFGIQQIKNLWWDFEVKTVDLQVFIGYAANKT